MYLLQQAAQPGFGGFQFIFLGLMILVFWLAIMNTFLYVLYRITGGKKRECPACGSRVKVGITNCSKCGFDFMKAAGN